MGDFSQTAAHLVNQTMDLFLGTDPTPLQFQEAVQEEVNRIFNPIEREMVRRQIPYFLPRFACL